LALKNEKTSPEINTYIGNEFLERGLACLLGCLAAFSPRCAKGQRLISSMYLCITLSVLLLKRLNQEARKFGGDTPEDFFAGFQ
jgi:hypothetical protein